MDILLCVRFKLALISLDNVRPKDTNLQLQDIQLQDTQHDTQQQDVQLQDTQHDTQQQDAQLQDTQHNTQQQDAQLQDTHCQQQDTQLQDTQLQNTQLQDTQLQDTQLQDTQLQDTQLQNTQQQDTQLELKEIENFLRLEFKNRAIDGSAGFSFYDCLAHTVHSSLERVPPDTEDSNTIRTFTSPEVLLNRVADLLSKHPKQFQPVIDLLVAHIDISSTQSLNHINENHLKESYDKVVSDCRYGRNLQQYTRLCLYAAATCLNTPIYIVGRNEFGRCGWAYFQPLFPYAGQPRSVIRYLTMAMTSDNTFFKVESRDMAAPRPNATGLVGMYIEVLEDMSPLEITVPEELLGLSGELRAKLCYNISRDTVLRSCILFLQRRLIPLSVYNSLTTHKAPREEFFRVVANSREAFQVVCQVLILRREKSILSEYVKNWNVFVRTCEYLRKFESLSALDNAIIIRNVAVTEFVNGCQSSGRELDERRKSVTSTVIASSSVGIVSGGMAVVGLVLAPVSFGASLALTIAGGAIGVGSGVTAGVARTIEAVKQNTTINDIKGEQAKMQNKEKEVADALERTELLFQTYFAETNNEGNDELGISKRGFFAVGSAVRVTNSVAHIALAAVRIGARAATISAAVLGPLSMVFDIAYLAEAAHNKATGDRTNAGEILYSIAETIEAKSKIFNGMLRGHAPESERMHGLYRWN